MDGLTLFDNASQLFRDLQDIGNAYTYVYG
jgi:hypothetical protein